MPGRYGRSAGRGFYPDRKPRYLSLAPPIPRFPPKIPLRGNPFEELAQQHYARLRSVRFDENTIIKTYSKDADDFLHSLASSASKSINPPCESHQNPLNKITISSGHVTNPKTYSHYSNPQLPNDPSWKIFTARTRTKGKQFPKCLFPRLSKISSTQISETTHTNEKPTPNLSLLSNRSALMVPSPTRQRITRSQSKRSTETKTSKPSLSPTPPNHMTPKLLKHDMTYGDVNKINVEDLRIYLHWWNNEQGSPVKKKAIQNMQPALLKREGHKVIDILKARFASKQERTAKNTVVSTDTTHEDLNTMTNETLRHLLAFLSKQCGERTQKSMLKVTTRNVLIAPIIDRRNTIGKAMSDIVAASIELSDDSDDSNESGDSGDDMSDGSSTKFDYDTQNEEEANESYIDDEPNMPPPPVTQESASSTSITSVNEQTPAAGAITTTESNQTIGTSPGTQSTTTTSVPANQISITNDTITTSNPTSSTVLSTQTSTPNDEAKPPEQVSTSQDKDTSVGALGHSGNNFRGVNIADNSPENSFQVGSLNVKTIVRNHFIIRATVKLVQGDHAPSIIRKVVQIMRQIDPAFLVHPWEPTNTSLNLVLNNETSLPNDETKIATWIRSIGRDRFGRLQFTFRASNTIDVFKFKGIVFKWATNYGHFIKIDKINSEQVFTAGWLINLHPQLYNRDAIKAWIDNHDITGELQDKFNVYARTIYQKIPNSTGSISAEAVAIDGAVSHRDQIYNLITNLNWGGVYHNSGFIPIKTNDIFTSAHVLKALETHKLNTKNLLSKTIKVTQYDKSISFLSNGTETSFHKWLSNCLLHQENLFIAVEKSKPHFVRMIYHNSKHSSVLSVVNGLHDSMTQFFGKAVADDILGTSHAYNASMPVTHKEASYFTALANTYAANPQDLDSPPPRTLRRKPRPKQAWFGNNPILENVEVVTTFTAPPSFQITVDDASKVSELEAKISTLSAENANLQQTVTSLVDQRLLPINEEVQKMSNSLATLEKSITATNKQNTIKFNSVVKTFGSAIQIVRKKDRKKARRREDALIQALNNINAKIGIAPVDGSTRAPAPETSEDPNPASGGKE